MKRKIKPRHLGKAVPKKEKGVWVYQGEPSNVSIRDLIDRERKQRSRDLLGFAGDKKRIISRR